MFIFYITTYISMKKILSLASVFLLAMTIVFPTTTLESNAQSFDTVLNWMHTNGLTKYQTADEFRPYDLITRWEASKFVNSAAWVMWLTKNYNQCTFSDITGYDYTLIPHIGDACAYGLLKWSKGNFMPNNTLTEAQAITIVMRAAMWQFLDETWDRRWSAYYEAGKEAGIITTESLDGVNATNVTRQKLGTWFYKAANMTAGQQQNLDGVSDLELLIQELLEI